MKPHAADAHDAGLSLSCVAPHAADAHDAGLSLSCVKPHAPCS